jgi:hypothetical protein
VSGYPLGAHYLPPHVIIGPDSTGGTGGFARRCAR